MKFLSLWIGIFCALSSVFLVLAFLFKVVLWALVTHNPIIIVLILIAIFSGAAACVISSDPEV